MMRPSDLLKLWPKVVARPSSFWSTKTCKSLVNAATGQDVSDCRLSASPAGDPT